MSIIHLHINSENIAAQDGRTFERRNPVTGQLVSTAAAASPQDALQAVEAASRAFAAWSAT
ncbi:MAG: aldehyde dehydrogenase family protein, partial [Xanthomonadaceae bacterium]|nr:aldehyde dehydrogenase family protein [Xanthomonadaceae bacterium]